MVCGVQGWSPRVVTGGMASVSAWFGLPSAYLVSGSVQDAGEPNLKKVCSRLS